MILMSWVLPHRNLNGEVFYRLVGKGKKQFRWRLPAGNPHLRTEARNTYTSLTLAQNQFTACFSAHSASASEINSGPLSIRSMTA